jgi:hypothetical protein
MADGWDLIFAKACLVYNIPIHCYIPFRDRPGTSTLYYEILKKAS